MEHSPDDPVCVIKVEVTCCTACQRKLRKILLRISGVLEVSYDPTTKLATIRGKFDPLMIIEAIKEKGKKAELISYSKHPLHEAHNSTSRNSNHHHNFEKTQNAHNKEEAAAYYKDKGKAKVGDDKKRNEHWWNSSEDNKKCEDFVSTKNKKKYHKAEAYVAPQGVDESICRDRYCKIHRRGGGIRDYVTQEERKKKYAMFMQMGGQYPAGFFNGLGQASYLQPPYQYYGPDYGFYPSAQPMSGVNDITRYFENQDSRSCSIM
ncbi:hypothetical protein RND71_043232 [Anisodus tanguticus]|uniref:HMA domain-containing protein n=1 Tax=Anisodus tanguticus TaxID=243964 RepID=A0AAE1QSF0_9SOLA|nr:hypothetical protein RND71_043232 [Anisodus tanguticus]